MYCTRKSSFVWRLKDHSGTEQRAHAALRPGALRLTAQQQDMARPKRVGLSALWLTNASASLLTINTPCDLPISAVTASKEMANCACSAQPLTQMSINRDHPLHLVQPWVANFR